MDQVEKLIVAVVQRFASGFTLRASLETELRAGSVLVLFGPSAAGKTTILRQLAGLERPDEGTIAFGGDVWCDVRGHTWRPAQARRVGVVFQQPALFPHLTVADNVRYGVRPLRAAAATERPRRDPSEMMRLLGVGALDRRYPRALSGGEAQRVALARALAADPRLLLLDEPFAALDAPTRLRLRRDVRALLQATGVPAVLVTHDRNEALAIGDTVAVVIDGQVRQVGRVADVFSRPADAGVAASLGVEAVLPGRVAASAGGLIEVAVGHAVLHVAERDPLPPGTDVYVCIRAEDVTVETRAAAQGSTRNHLAARVVGISSEGPIDRVTLDCGFPLDALITHRSREELDLVTGASVTAAIKATSVHLVPRA